MGEQEGELGWETDFSFLPRYSPSTSILSSFFVAPSRLCTFAFFLLAFFLPAFFPPAFFPPAFFLLRSRVRNNSGNLELLVYNRTFALSVLGLCCPRSLYPSTSSSLCDS